MSTEIEEQKMRKADAYYRLAKAYRNGYEYEKDMDLVKEYYTRAVSLGHPKAAVELGYLYTNGSKREFKNLKEYKLYLQNHGGKDVFEHNAKLAVEMYLKAYDLGYQNHDAEYHPLELAFLACKYDPKDLEATELFMQKLKTLIAYDEIAFYVLGRCYDVGLGVKQNKKMAANIYDQAIQNGVEQAKIFMAWLYYRGEAFSPKYSAYSLFLELANKGVADAYYGVAKCYINGIGTPQDVSKGIKWLQKGVQHNFSDCCYMLGKMYLSGQHLEQNEQLGEDLLLRGLGYNNQRCALTLAEYYYYQKGTPQDILKAMQCLRIGEYRHSYIAKEWRYAYCVTNKISKKDLYEQLDKNPLGLENTKYTRRV